MKVRLRCNMPFLNTFIAAKNIFFRVIIFYYLGDKIADRVGYHTLDVLHSLKEVDSYSR
jgi:hypothetical protein